MRGLLFILLTGFMLWPSLGQAAPAISFTEATYDFGEVTQGQGVEHSFEFTNAGNEDLVIEKLTGS